MNVGLDPCRSARKNIFGTKFGAPFFLPCSYSTIKDYNCFHECTHFLRFPSFYNSFFGSFSFLDRHWPEIVHCLSNFQSFSRFFGYENLRLESFLSSTSFPIPSFLFSVSGEESIWNIHVFPCAFLYLHLSLSQFPATRIYEIFMSFPINSFLFLLLSFSVTRE